MHHLVYPRRHYHEHPSGATDPKEFRESPALMVRVPQQFHNYIHEIFDLPPEPEMDVMHQWVKEQAQVSQLFFLGKTAIQLSRRARVNPDETNVILEERTRTLRDARQITALFYDFLEAYDDGQLGLMPDKQWLANQTLGKATRALGQIAGARSLDVRRDTQTIIKRVGYADAA